MSTAIITILAMVLVLVQAQITINTQTTKFESFEPTAEAKIRLEDKDFWFNLGEDYLQKNLKAEAVEKEVPVARNVIIFLGDGMGISTITAARIYKGQRRYGKSGEDHNLVFDTFPNVGLVKTYNVDKQVPDSAATATALFTGAKTRYECVGVDVKCNQTVFEKDVFEASKVESIMTWAQGANKHTGIITTTRITHATPAATYAHASHRDWACDNEVPLDARPYVKDIARQLIEDAPGNNFKVIMGGGLQHLGFYDHDLSDGECVRTDGRNLTQTWIERHTNQSAIFATTTSDLEKVTSDTDFLLGLFAADHLPYELERDTSAKGTPSLAEMTRKALQILTKSPQGFVLMVEGGRIDLAHHHNLARAAMEETSQFDDAIALAVESTESDTLILVTADHSHTLTLNGYSERGNDILGVGIADDDNKPALTLTYANGPGFQHHYQPDIASKVKPWREAESDPARLNDPFYAHMGAFEVEDETHGGEDVALYAKGPGAYLVRGVFEQNYVAHLISYASCIGPRAALNPHCENKGSSSSHNYMEWLYVPLVIILHLLLHVRLVG